MHFFKSLFVGVAALAAAVSAQSKSLYFTSTPTNVEVMHSYTLAWVAPNMNAPVTIYLKKGPANNLHTVSTITSTATGGSYVWTPDYDLVSGTNYAFEITQGNQINYSGTVVLNGGRSPRQSSASPSSPAPVATSTPYTSYASPVSVPSSPVYHSTSVPPPIVTGTATGTGIPIPRNTTFHSATIPATSAPPPPSTAAPYPSPTLPPSGADGLDAHIAMVFGAAIVAAALI